MQLWYNLHRLIIDISEYLLVVIVKLAQLNKDFCELRKCLLINYSEGRNVA